ncbi:ImmA/IrrE family metallo-endopeptidase [Virgibacillus sp. M23]|uniref:ImmA/IrrE family metallo-endopeptidase n=1 Tax=Virgibacillus sp. M23 TaxID=3079030 RepID=UPI002A914403|nr:ImmA/IrrE family metallo-endopeptidase [Virgibacillus sp. M23]MDY7044388.1 ImmA/IrrE family metallo-endopeptidase [Virgibacillus sp. M23]
MLVYSHTEEYIKKLLLLHQINNPYELTVNTISKAINIPVHYWEYGSESNHYRGKYIVFLNETDTKEQQWQDFTHELCHIFWHAGRQENLPLPFMQLQEWQANNFSYHLCVPTFMLDKLYNYTVYDVMRLFNVEYDFACRRLEMYRSKFYFMEGYHEHYIVGS